VVKLLAVVIIAVALLGGGDVVARHWAESQLASRIEASLPGSHATVHISSFPFVGRLAAAGSVSKITAHVDKVQRADLPLTLAFVDLEVEGVKLDRNALWQDQKVKLRRISRGTVRAEITDAAVSAALGGVPVQFGNGTVEVVAAGLHVRATASIQNNKLVLAAAGIGALAVTIPKLSVLPCAASATVRPGRVDVSCEIHEIPQALLTAAA
jgi:hypothetical protein